MSTKVQDFVREHEGLRKQAQRRGISYEELLVEDNIRLAYHMANKYHSDVVPLDDAISASLEGLWRAACSYDPVKGVKFSHYAATCMQRAIFLMYRQYKRHAEVSSLNDLADAGRDGSWERQEFVATSVFDAPGDDGNFEDSVVLRVDMERALSRLPEAHRQYLGMRFLAHMTVKEVATAMDRRHTTLRGYRQEAFRRLRHMLS